MKIVNGIMAQLPYTPPRTQLCIVELEDVCVTTSGDPTNDKILAPMYNENVTLDSFVDAGDPEIIPSFDPQEF